MEQQVVSCSFTVNGSGVYASYEVTCPVTGCPGGVRISDILVGRSEVTEEGWEFRPIRDGHPLAKPHLLEHWPQGHCPVCGAMVALTRRAAELLPSRTEQWAQKFRQGYEEMAGKKR